MKKNFIIIHPLFFLVLIISIIFYDFYIILFYFLSLILHEFGHAIMVKYLGYKLDKFILMPYGICLKTQSEFFSPKDEVLIAVAGPIVNLLLSIITVASWWLFPASYSITLMFAVINISLFIINLIPAYPLDGGRIFVALLSKKYSRQKSINYSIIINIIFTIILCVFFIVSAFYKINYFFIIFAVFIFLGIFDGKFSGKYSNKLLCYNLSKINNPKISQNIVINKYEKIYKLSRYLSSNKYTIFYVILDNGKMLSLTETKLCDICLNIDVSKSIAEIFGL